MKKSTIWILTIVMACSFLGLLAVQIMYMENIIKMRNEQFSELVKRSLYGVSTSLEHDETRYFLEKDVNDIDAAIYSNNYVSKNEYEYSINTPEGSANFKVQGNWETIKIEPKNGTNISGIKDHYKNMQETLKGQYLYQKGMLNEVILNILSKSSDRPITERADSAVVNRYLKYELESNGINLPYEYALVDRAGHEIYKSPGFNSNNSDNESESYTQVIFPNDPLNKMTFLKVIFPTKNDYIFSSIRFMIPSFAFTFILLVVFLFTIIIAFRQKKLSEMKNDFINNMTHELKTPISSISLGAQMLNDDSMRKSPAMLQHISGVINDETKRLRFLVEKVLQMSMFDNQNATLKLEEVDANLVIENVVHTHKLKIEKFGGTITTALNAEDSIVNVDNMHFTNVIFNLLDNAIKYRREEVPLELSITTRNIGDEQIEIIITDNGIGIKKEDLKKIFEKFYRVSTGNRHDVKGFGLGLAYVHKLITQFKGSIHAESEINNGSKFIIILPLIK